MTTTEQAPPAGFRRPPAWLLAAEAPRAAVELAAFGALWPLLATAPRGDGHPVLVLPGMAASDGSTRPLRTFLRNRNYHVHAWRLGRNMGPNRRTITGLRARVRDLAALHGRPMSLVGWSLGGIFAREIARAAPPGVVRQVITLGSPIRLRYPGPPDGDAPADRLRRTYGPRRDPRPPEEERGPLPVPATAVYSRTDAIVPWRACLEVPSPTSESVEVAASHVGLGLNPGALWVVADRLAQPEDTWAPFEARGVGRLLLWGGG